MGGFVDTVLRLQGESPVELERPWDTSVLGVFHHQWWSTYRHCNIATNIKTMQLTEMSTWSARTITLNLFDAAHAILYIRANMDNLVKLVAKSNRIWLARPIWSDPVMVSVGTSQTCRPQP